MKDYKGFTLIELMVTVAVLAIVLSLAIPSFRSILLSNRIETAAQELHGAMQLARSEAVKRKGVVRVCGSNVDPDDLKCVNGTNWSAGWLVVLNGTNEVLKAWETPEGLAITGPTTGVEFLGSGMVRSAENFTVTASSCTSGHQRTLAVKRIGTSSLEKSSC